MDKAEKAAGGAKGGKKDAKAATPKACTVADLTFTLYTDAKCTKAAVKTQVLPTDFVSNIGKCVAPKKPAVKGHLSYKATCLTDAKGVSTLTVTSYSDAKCTTALTPVETVVEDKCTATSVVPSTFMKIEAASGGGVGIYILIVVIVIILCVAGYFAKKKFIDNKEGSS